MSSRYVRLLAENWAQSCTTPYYSTMNEEQAPQDEIWMTMEFDSYGYTKESFCSTWTETGGITMVFFGPAGTGWETLFERAEQDVAAFLGNADPGGKVVITGRDAPDEIKGQDIPFYEVSVTVNYEYRP